MDRKRNRRYVLTFIAGIILFCPFYGPLAKGDVNLVELAKKIRPSVVLIQTFDKDKKPLGRGSGFFIDKKGHLITNCHVLKGAYSAEVKTFNGLMYPVKLVLSEKHEVDLIKVLVDIPEKATKFVQVTNIVPEVAERVLVVGSPLGLEQTVSEGIVSAVREIPTIGKIFQISAPLSPGSSGSPVVNMKGQVIGVATFQMIEGQNLNFAVSGENVLALKSKKKGKALKEWTSDVSNKQTKSAWNLYLKGVKLTLAGEYEKALNSFKMALDEDSRYEMAWLGIGVCYQDLARYEEAVEAFKQAIRIDPNSSRGHFGLVWTYQELGRYQEAILAYKQAIRINPDEAEVHYFLGHTYSDLGRYQEAIEAYKQAIRIKPDFAIAHFNLGKVYTLAGRYTETLEAFKQAIRIKPDYVMAHFGLGLGYLLLGDKSSALDEYKILKILDKNLANKLFDHIYK